MTQPLIAYVNDCFVPLGDAKVHVEDRGFQFGDGVYEVVACFGGHFLDLRAHLQRLQRSCAAIALTMPKSIETLEGLVAEIYHRNPFDDAMVYIQITRGVAPRSHVVQQPLQPTLVMTVRALPKPDESKVKQGATAITLADMRWKHCEIKSISLLATVMGKQEAVRQGVDEAFWKDAEGHVLEGCATNVFAIIEDVLVTHPLDHQVLGGITRDLVLKLARQAGLELQERAWSLQEKGLTECLMSSTTNAVLPVCRIDGKAVGQGKPGRYGLLLRDLMLKHIAALRAQA